MRLRACLTESFQAASGMSSCNEPLMRNLANRAMVRSTISTDFDMTRVRRRNRASQWRRRLLICSSRQVSFLPCPTDALPGIPGQAPAAPPQSGERNQRLDAISHGYESRPNPKCACRASHGRFAHQSPRDALTEAGVTAMTHDEDQASGKRDDWLGSVPALDGKEQ